MAIARELSKLVAMTPDDTATWRIQELESGIAYIELEPGRSSEVSEIIEMCAEQPARLFDEGEILSKRDSTVLRLSDFAIKIFNLAPNIDPWERECRAGVCAVRAAVMQEYGLARVSALRPLAVPAQETNPNVAAAHLYGAFYPTDEAFKPYWIMSYEPGEPSTAMVDLLRKKGQPAAEVFQFIHGLQSYLDKAFEYTDGERLRDTMVFENNPGHWCMQRAGDQITKLVKLGGYIKPEYASKVAWENAKNLFFN